MRRCQRCGLGPGVRAIFGRFDRPEWMMVGQAPGLREIDLDRPFAGPAGKRLFGWLESVGFSEDEFRSMCYVTAVMKCFPGKGQRGDLRPSRVQLKNCGRFLGQELELVKPSVVIPVGALAIERFLGKRRLEDAIGRRFVVEVPGRATTVIPLPHPSGASAWTNAPANHRLIRRALRLIRSATSGR
ncbi:MAG: uracil-DNA glycosylase [candidate division WOR-3 bacterium]|nr:MAG: uracil-DNA glycosylase [candidate division WOR-3 bacterium]